MGKPRSVGAQVAGGVALGRSVRLTPRPHQLRAVSDVQGGFERGDRGQLIMACGTGKTVVSLWAAERLGARRILVLAPMISLLEQFACEWWANTARPLKGLLVCSDGTAGQRVWAASAPIAVTTAQGEVQDFMHQSGSRVVFSTNQSLKVVAEAQRAGAPSFDLVIADEAHHIAGEMASDWGLVLDDAYLSARRRLFMTATPKTYSAASEDGAIASMDDPVQFGPVFHRLGFREAIDRGLLADYRVALVAVQGDAYTDLIDRRATMSVAGMGHSTAADTATQIGLLKAMRKYGLKRVLSYHRTVAGAREFGVALARVVPHVPPGQRPGRVATEYVSGLMTARERSERLAIFDTAGTDGAVVANARCLNEGVDLPTVDGVCFVDPRYSAIDIAQAVGRALRRSPGKGVGTVVLPIHIGGGQGRPRGDGRATRAFGHVVSVIEALRSHDEDLDAFLLGRLTNRDAFGEGGALPPGFEVTAESALGEQFVRSVAVWLLTDAVVGREWHLGYEQLLDFVRQEGHARVPVRGEKRDLGDWVRGQRTSHASGRLKMERVRLLEGLPQWSWESHTALRWRAGYGELLRFAVVNGHTQVPRECVVNGFALGLWSKRQAEAQRAGRLSRACVEALESIPQGWSCARRNEAVDPGAEDRVVEAYLAGASMASVAEVGGISLYSVYRVLRKRGLPLRRPGIPRDLAPRVRQLLEAGVNPAAIAREFGVDASTVRKMAHKNG